MLDEDSNYDVVVRCPPGVWLALLHSQQAQHESGAGVLRLISAQSRGDLAETRR